MQKGFYKLPIPIGSSTYILIMDNKAFYFGLNSYGEQMVNCACKNDFEGQWFYSESALISMYPSTKKDEATLLLQKSPLEYICGPTKEEFFYHFADLINEISMRYL